ncbi:MAG: hypothetical protein FD148_2926 [Methylocystaceae bacterium]|nr:MAG: hypothetical protein FD148_2926 [Methylocystaceae bacterium]
MPTFFRYLSVTEMAALFCLGFLAATWLGVFLFRTLAHQWIHGRRNANEMIGLTLAAFSTLYGILLGLLAVEAYQDFSAVADVVSKEALTIAAADQQRASGKTSQLRTRGGRGRTSAA